MKYLNWEKDDSRTIHEDRWSSSGQCGGEIRIGGGIELPGEVWEVRVFMTGKCTFESSSGSLLS
jgi:hypothetical protein